MDKILKFVEVLNEFRKVERTIYIRGGDRRENDSEHSYQLAMLAWYIAEADKLPLDTTKLIRYALLHDLVEVYAGDTFIYADQEHLDSKDTREKDALLRLRTELPEAGGFWDCIDAYEKREDAESRFIYALDKVYPLISIYLNGGREWKEWNVTLEMLFENKADKVAFSPEIEKYFHELITLLQKEHGNLFNNGR